MNRCVILLVYWYPFTKYGEQFLDNEIKYLSENFKKVIIISCYRSAQSQYSREVKYKNIEVMRIVRQKKSLEVIKSLGELIKSKEFWRELNIIKGSFKFETFKSLFIATINQITIKKLIKEKLKNQNLQKFDELIFYSYWFSSLAGVGSDLKNYYLNKFKSKNIKVISRAHGTSDVYGTAALGYYLPFRKYYYHNLDKVYPVSYNAENFLSEKVNDKEKFKTIYLGTKDYGVSKVDFKEASDILTIVSCSNIVNIKRVHLIAHALSNIKDFKVHWIHFGSGPLEECIKKEVKNLPSNIKTEFKGAVSNYSLIEYYKNQRINLFINVSESEGVPVSILEAISFGIPVIATNVGGTSEAVHDQYNGYLINKDFEIDELSSLIVKFIEMDFVTYNDFRLHSRTIWENKFKEDINHSKFIEDIQNL